MMMQTYKAPDNSLHELSESDIANGGENYLPPGCVQITNAEADAMRAPSVDQIKAHQWNAIKAERDRRKVGGVKVKVGTTNKWFHSDDASRIQQMGLVMMGTNMPADLQWKTLDGSFVAMTPTVAGNVFAAAAASDQAIFAVAETHKVAMEASADPSTYDFSTGWPKIYGE